MGITASYSRVSASCWLTEFSHSKHRCDAGSLSYTAGYPPPARQHVRNVTVPLAGCRTRWRWRSWTPPARYWSGSTGMTLAPRSAWTRGTQPRYASHKQHSVLCPAPCVCFSVSSAELRRNGRAAAHAGTCPRCCIAWASTPQRPASGLCLKRRALQPHSVLPQALLEEACTAAPQRPASGLCSRRHALQPNPTHWGAPALQSRVQSWSCTLGRVPFCCDEDAQPLFSAKLCRI